jgi:hypothetical protein
VAAAYEELQFSFERLALCLSRSSGQLWSAVATARRGRAVEGKTESLAFTTAAARRFGPSITAA